MRAATRWKAPAAEASAAPAAALPQALAAPPTARPEDEDEDEQRNGGRNYDGVSLVGRKTRKGVVLQQDGLAQTIGAAPGCLHPRAERLHFVLPTKDDQPLEGGPPAGEIFDVIA